MRQGLVRVPAVAYKSVHVVAWCRDHSAHIDFIRCSFPACGPRSTRGLLTVVTAPRRVRTAGAMALASLISIRARAARACINEVALDALHPHTYNAQ